MRRPGSGSEGERKSDLFRPMKACPQDQREKKINEGIERADTSCVSPKGKNS